MRYLIEISQRQATEITKLIDERKYQNVAQFITTAIENQIYIENSDEMQICVRVEEKNSNGLLRSNITLIDTNKINKLSEIKNQPQTVSMPAFHDLSASLYDSEEEKRWLWGQVNKILPIKIGLRVLLLKLETEKWIDLEEYKDDAASIAANIGTAIKKYENKRGKTRDERISAGLPEEKGEKSKNRYKSHFLAYIRKDKKLDGAMPFLRFVNLNKDEKDKVFIGLTEAGLEFARLQNPVLDNSNYEKSFTEKEINFYLQHIVSKVRGESCAVEWLLKKIVNGMKEREKINNELKRDFGEIWGASDAVINTQRAGLTARMFELGLIEKKKMGVRVIYNISEKGKIFLEKL